MILVLHNSQNIMLERQLVYTAITRTRKLLLIVGTKSALAIATRRNRGRTRFTSLKSRLEPAL